MTDFTATWLDLREPADHRSRNGAIAQALGKHFEGRREITIVDLGCGTGSNLRATAPLLGPEQHWLLVDRERGLLEAAAGRLTMWADGADWSDETLLLRKGGKRISVAFRRADLAHDLEAAIGPNADLIAASALFDLVSADFIARLSADLARRRCAFYTVLTYDGAWRWLPECAADRTLLDAFNAHQRRDKGFGPAAGPDACEVISAAVNAVGHRLLRGDSAWRLGTGDDALLAQLAAEFAVAAGETGRVDAAVIAGWRALARTGAVVGHADILALPPC
jgi:SAM-dependent methyltransferase